MRFKGGKNKEEEIIKQIAMVLKICQRWAPEKLLSYDFKSLCKG